MPYKLPELPYAMEALAPYLSKETLEYHYGKHHKAYVDKLNTAIEGTPMAGAPLEEIVRSSEGPLFNSAAQVWNHTFYWNCMRPRGGGEPTGAVAAAINKSFEAFESFRQKFSEAAVNNFGSGWTWLVKKEGGRLAIENTSNAGTPIKTGGEPILTIDIWEHAYYIDYRNARADYVKAFWNLVNWDFVNKKLG